MADIRDEKRECRNFDEMLAVLKIMSRKCPGYFREIENDNMTTKLLFQTTVLYEMSSTVPFIPNPILDASESKTVYTFFRKTTPNSH